MTDDASAGPGRPGTGRHPANGRPGGDRPHVLIVEARFYEHIAELQAKGAVAALEAAGATFDRVTVPGALEAPAVVAMALDTEEYDAFVVLGCVLRGETGHYDIVAGESARALMDLAVQDGALIGNGILTCENEEQALARADPAGKDKGGDAVKAALALLELRGCFDGMKDD